MTEHRGGNQDQALWLKYRPRKADPEGGPRRLMHYALSTPSHEMKSVAEVDRALSGLTFVFQAVATKPRARELQSALTQVRGMLRQRRSDLLSAQRDGLLSELREFLEGLMEYLKTRLSGQDWKDTEKRLKTALRALK